MPLFLKTVRPVCKFCQKLALEYTKVMKVGIFLELDTLDSYPVPFGITEGLTTFNARLRRLCLVRGFALLAITHEMLN